MGVARATMADRSLRLKLPTIVCKGFVGLCHAVCVFALAHCRAAVFCSVHQLVSQTERHGFLAAVASCLDDPAHRQCLAASSANFNGHLVGGAADTAGLH